MMALLRRMLHIQVCISRADAVQIAKQHCELQDWPWLEPIFMTLGLRNYEIMTNSSYKGGNATIRIDCTTGRITGSGYADR